MIHGDVWTALAVLLLLAVLLTALAHGYHVEEDGLVENLQAVLLAVSAVTATVRGVLLREMPRLRGLYLVAAVVVAWVFLEEISYGQRLFGFATPAYFTAHNVQGEVNFHNFANGAVEWAFAVAVVIVAGLATIGRRTRLGRWMPLPRYSKLLLVAGYVALWVGAKVAVNANPPFAHVTGADLDEVFELGLYGLLWLLLVQRPERVWIGPGGRPRGGPGVDG